MNRRHFFGEIPETNTPRPETLHPKRIKGKYPEAPKELKRPAGAEVMQPGKKKKLTVEQMEDMLLDYYKNVLGIKLLPYQKEIVALFKKDRTLNNKRRGN